MMNLPSAMSKKLIQVRRLFRLLFSLYKWCQQHLQENPPTSKCQLLCIMVNTGLYQSYRWHLFLGAIHPSRTQHTTLCCTALSKCACSLSLSPVTLMVSFGKRRFQDTESLKEASLNGLLIYAFVCQLPTNWHLALHLTAEYTLPE